MTLKSVLEGENLTTGFDKRVMEEFFLFSADMSMEIN